MLCSGLMVPLIPQTPSQTSCLLVSTVSPHKSKRNALNWSSLLTMLTQLKLFFSFQPSAAEWASHTALSRVNPDSEDLLASRTVLVLLWPMSTLKTDLLWANWLNPSTPTTTNVPKKSESHGVDKSCLNAPKQLLPSSSASDSRNSPRNKAEHHNLSVELFCNNTRNILDSFE